MPASLRSVLVLFVASGMLFASTSLYAQAEDDAFAQVDTLTPAQKRQLDLNAMQLLNTTAGQIRGVAQMRQAFVDQYLAEKDLLAAYKAKKPSKEQVILAKNWNEDAAEGKQVPVTFEEAMQMAVIAEVNNGGIDDATSATAAQLPSLNQQAKAMEKLARDSFRDVLKTMGDVEAKANFIKDEKKWDDFIAWADAKMAADEAAAADEKAAMLEANRARVEAEKAERKDRMAQLQTDKAARAAEREAQQQVALEQAWDRQVQAYELETQRIKAKRSTRRYWVRDKYWYRRW